MTTFSVVSSSTMWMVTSMELALVLVQGKLPNSPGAPQRSHSEPQREVFTVWQAVLVGSTHWKIVPKLHSPTPGSVSLEGEKVNLRE